MILFLRDAYNNTIVDVEIWNSSEFGVDMSVYIDIPLYSQLLLNADDEIQPEVIGTFSYLQDLRGWFWEVFVPAYKDEPDSLYTATIANVRKGLKEIAEQFNLYYVED